MKRQSLKHVLIGLVALLVVTAVLPGIVRASVVSSLEELKRTQGSFDVGDKRFSNFDYAISGVGTWVASGAGIDVAAAPDPGNFGIQFLGPISALALAPNTMSSVLVTISFDVTIFDPASPMYIKDIELSFNGATQATAGMASANVTEFAKSGPALVAQAMVNTQNPPTSLYDHKEFAPLYKTLHIEKVISAVADTTGATAPGAAAFAHISLVEQRFSQVPEPTTMLLLASGAMLFVRRRYA